MKTLVERLRLGSKDLDDRSFAQYALDHEAAERIESLEKELDEARKLTDQKLQEFIADMRRIIDERDAARTALGVLGEIDLAKECRGWPDFPQHGTGAPVSYYGCFCRRCVSIRKTMHVAAASLTAKGDDDG